MIQYHIVEILKDLNIAFAGSETPTYLETEVLIILGRGIENYNGHWFPTRLIEKGIGEYSAHSGTSHDGIDPDTGDDIVIGGGNSNVRACYEIIKRFHEAGRELPFVIFSAGRPNYLENTDLSISEGSVMRKKLTYLLERDHIELPKTEIISSNKSTLDDINFALKICADRGYKRVSIVTIEPHLLRSWHMTRKALNEKDIDQRLTQVEFINSWNVLSEIDTKYKGIFDRLRKTKAYQRTQMLEKGGLDALFRGRTSTQK